VVKRDEMNIFGSKKEAWVMAGLAAFFVLVTLGFTLEPLISVILRSRSLPSETKEYLIVAPALQPKGDFFDGIMKNVPPSHGWAGNVDLLTKVKGLVFGLNITAATVQNNSVAIEAANDPTQVVTDIRRFLSKLTPFEIQTVMPDQTTMTETVIDPSLIAITTDLAIKPTVWTFTQTNPQLVIKKNGSNSSILINYPQVVDTHGFESPTGCSVSGNGIKTVTYNFERQTLLSAVFNGFSAYFRDYSCFQSFSTLIQ
jgi:hypothetical protein